MADPITSEIFGRVVKDQEVWNFNIGQDGIYIVSISARCKNWAQNFKHLFNDDDLALQIDDYLFAEMKGKKREFSSPGSWNGNEIKNNSKTVLFILPLRNGSHKITFWVDVTPTVEEIKIYKIEQSDIDLVSSNIFEFEKFSDVIIKNLTVEELKVSATVAVGSNLEIKVDGQSQINLKYKRYKKWYWYGQELKGGSKEYQTPNGFDKNQHSLELDCQGKPTITSFKLKIDTENVEYEAGHVRLYDDIQSTKILHLRSTPSDENNEILAEIKDGERVEIHNEKVSGKYIESFSDTWHEIIFNNIRGYVLSSFIEIEGQEREKIIDLIKEKCNQYKVDGSIMLAIAGRESHFKPYARSFSDRKGIFQLGEGALKDVSVTDPYDFYQNIDGGIRYYKSIETSISGRGDVLIKRLAAWHDGPTVIRSKISNKLFDYNKLSVETKSFIKSVLANIAKKDWYHIISIPVIILFLVSSLFIGEILIGNVDGDTSQMATVITSVEEVPSHEMSNVNDMQPAAYFPNAGKNISSTSAFYYSDKTGFIDDASNFPEVLSDELNHQITFVNSKKEVVGSINMDLLKLEKFLYESDITDDTNFYNFTNVEPVVLENPSGVFYFLATNSYGCGASNCTFVFYRFNLNDGELENIDTNVFGGIAGLYLSPDLKQIALIRGISSGSCNNGDYISVYNLQDFSKQEIGIFTDVAAGNRNVKNVKWKNNQEIQFDAVYQLQCGYNVDMITTWLYDTQTKQIKKLKSETVDHGPVAG